MLNGQYKYGTKESLLNKGYQSIGIIGDHEYFCKSGEEGEIYYNFTNLQGDVLMRFPNSFMSTDIELFIKMKEKLQM